MKKVFSILGCVGMLGSYQAASAEPFFSAQDSAAEKQVTGQSVSIEGLFTSSRQALFLDPEKALRDAQSAEVLARRAGASPSQKQNLAMAFWLQAEALYQLNRAEEASPIIDRAVILVGKQKRETRLGADLTLTRARIARYRGHIEEALIWFREAFDIYSTLDIQRQQAVVLQDIGSMYIDARDYDRGIEYYERSARLYPDDIKLELIAHDNIARAFEAERNYEAALENYEKAYANALALDSEILKISVLTNMAGLHIKAGSLEAAQATVNEGLALAQRIKSDKWTQFLWGRQAQIDWAWGKNGPAKANFAKLFEGQNLSETPLPFMPYHQAAYRTYKSTEDWEMALAHLEAFGRLENLAKQAAASANVALLATEFDFTTQKLEIEKLKTGQLEQEMALSVARDRQQRTIGGFIVLLSCVVIGAMGFGYLSIRRSRNSIRDAKNELQISNEQLAKANNAKTEFLATTSHEIRTPLNGILGMTEVILKDNDLSTTDRTRLETVRTAGNSLLAIVNDILDVAKIEAGRMKVIEMPVELRRSIHETIELWRDNAIDKGLDVVIDIDELPQLVTTDEKYIRQIVFNLLSNAVKFTEMGEIRITGRVDGNAEDEKFLIQIKDTGIGIPDDQLGSIFKTFQQVETGANRKYGGTGLGLAICSKLALLMDGDLTVESEEGRGSTFTLSLPCKRLASHAHAQPTPSKENVLMPRLKTLDVLVAEDNTVNQIVVESLLKENVRSIDVVADGSQVLEALRVKKYDLILMDKQMPGMDGIAATEAIRNSGKPWNDIYIVAVTADAFDGAREQLIASGMNDYLAKPISHQALIDVLLKALERTSRQPAEQQVVGAE